MVRQHPASGGTRDLMGHHDDDEHTHGHDALASQLPVVDGDTTHAHGECGHDDCHCDHDHAHHEPGHHEHGHHDHSHHDPAQFRDRFWITLALTVPVVFFSEMFQHLLGYSAPEFAGSTWISPVLGT